MRIRISHKTVYRYEPPSTGLIQRLRLTPRNHDGQQVHNWQIDVSTDSRLESHQDAFGNITHVLTHGPTADLIITVEGVVQTHDTGGVLRGTDERFPPSLFLRSTRLTEVDPAMASFARELRSKSENDVLGFLHVLMMEINEQMTFDDGPTKNGTSAAEAFTAKRGAADDYAHVFIASARSTGVPARFTSGHFLRSDGIVDQPGGYAWAEAFVPDLGWVGFDPVNGICTTDAHVRVAVGLDYLDVAPVRGTRYGGGKETLSVHVNVEQFGLPEVYAAHAKLLERVKTLEKARNDLPAAAGMGHNNPPEILEADPLNQDEFNEIGTAVELLESQPVVPDRKPSDVIQVAKRLQTLGRKVQTYLATKADIFISEMVKTAGAETAKWGIRLAAWGVIAEALLQASHSILQWIRALAQLF